MKKLKRYWNEITKIPLAQFTKPYIKTAAAEPRNRKLLYGVAHIRYNDKRLLETIKGWIDEYTNTVW